MADRGAHIFAQVLTHPGDALATDDVVGVDHVTEAGKGSDVSPDDDGGVGRKLAHHAAHFAHLADVRDDRGNADDVVRVGLELAGEGVASGKIQQRARRGDVVLDHHDSPGAVKHAQGESALRAGDLVVVKLHGIDGAAAEFVVLRVGAKDRGEQHSGVTAFGVGWYFRNTNHVAMLAASSGEGL
jgi:hypothetical protein